MPLELNIKSHQGASEHTPQNFSDTLEELAPEQRKMASILLDMGVKPHHVHIALERAQNTGEPLPRIMRDFGFLSLEQVAQAVSKESNYPYFSPEEIEGINKAEMAQFEIGVFRRYVPVKVDEKGIVVIAISDPSMSNAAKNEFYRFNTKLVIASEYTIQMVYRRFFAKTEEQFDEAVAKFNAVVTNGRRGAEDEEASGIVRQIFGTLIRHACYAGASDLYLYKSEYIGIIKLKINGSGQLFRTIDEALYDRLMNKLATENVKVEDLRKEPKEGSIEFADEDKKLYEDVISRFGFRLELTESRSVRNAVIRILDKQSNATDFEKLGFDEHTLKTLRRISNTSTGLMLVTGPTGSGKTTSLYAMLKNIDPVERSIQSIEDPIEYRLGLWQQYEIRKDATDKGVEYNNWLKGLLRNAPDVILLGETRDAAVAQILLDAANTGHLVFSTLHTNNATMALARLKRLGCDPDTLASVLLGILAQRLVRILCPRCKVLDTSTETSSELDGASYLGDMVRNAHKAGEGCDHCDFTGYRGRRMIYELLEMTNQVQRLIEDKTSPSKIAAAGIAPGRSMWANGMRLVAKGETSLEELLRVAKRDNDETVGGD